MTKKTFLIAVFALLTTPVFAQEPETEYELRSDEKRGWIIDHNGKKIDGIVKLAGTEDTPWENQLKVKFIANDAIDLNKRKQKLKTLNTKDLKGYASYEGDLLREFEVINYKNIRESSTSDGSGIAGKVKLIKNLSRSEYMAEILVKGAITVYKLYGLPSSVAIGKKEVEEREKDIRLIREKPAILVSKNGGKIEELSAADMKKLTEDCEYVRAKMLNKEYPSYNPDREEKKRSKFGALLKSEMELSNEKIQIMATEILSDYNSNCDR